MAKDYKTYKRRIQRQLNEDALQDFSEFIKGAFGVKRGSERQEEIEQLKDIVKVGSGIIKLEDGTEIEVNREDAQDLVGFLKLMEYDSRFIDQMFKNRDGFNIVAKMAFGAGIFSEDEY